LGVVAALALVSAGTATSAKDRAWARAIALKRSDLPAGWAAAASAGEAATCVKPGLAGVRTTARTLSRLFQRKDFASVRSITRVVSTPAQARKAFGRFTSYKYAPCFTRIAKKQVQGKPVTVDKVTPSAPPFPRIGDRAAARRVTIDFKAGSFSVTSDYDLVFVQRGRVITTTIFVGVGSPLPSSFERAVVRKLAARMRPPSS
jgi:hypothetical protein